MAEPAVIPLADLRYRAVVPAVPTAAPPPAGDTTDRLGRPLRDLRISVTDRCNFRCSYCMPKEVFDAQHVYLPQASLLSFEEITRTASLFARHGVAKLRLTGGEPLLRRNLERLVESLAALRGADGQPLELTLTTNGTLLPKKAQVLAAAGLHRVTVSLDAIDDGVFRRMNDVDFPVADVLRGIDAALRAGLSPLKINMVVRRGVNEHEVLPLARHVREHYGRAATLRCIEFMDVGATNGWRMDEVVPSEALRQRLDEAFGLEALPPTVPGETAERFRYRDGRGEVGFISSVTKPFCGGCHRARLSTEGRLYTCLFASRGHDLRALLRGTDAAGRPWSDEQITAAIGLVWQQRGDRYSELRAAAGAVADRERIEMHYIGG
jgi:cyclic pyranopterin phosphate synthase